jgi:hypothetical protein
LFVPIGDVGTALLDILSRALKNKSAVGPSYVGQPTTTMKILRFGGFDGCTQGGTDAAKWLKLA